MKSIQGLFFCAVATMVLWAGSAIGDDATITLDVNFSGAVGTAGTWQLSGRIDDTGSGVNGDFGLSAVRALLDNIDFGTNGDAITFAPGNGAIDPLLDEFGNVVRPPVLQQPGGTIDLIYGQDLSESPTFPGSGTSNVVVPLVGTSGDILIASGTFSAGSTPAFGQDDTGPSTLFTQALFLTNGAAPYSGTIDPDNTFTVTNLNTAGAIGDYNNNGTVDAADYTVWLDALGSAGPLQNDPLGGTIGSTHYNQWKANFGNTTGAGTGSGTPVPEPCTLFLALAMASMTLCRRQRG